VCALPAQLEENCEIRMNQNQDKQITGTNKNFLGYPWMYKILLDLLNVQPR
jgi:hypothetical protein